MDMGQGLFVAIGQMVAEELDVPFKARHRVHGRHPHQREPGRRLRLDRHPARRQADARGGRRGAPRAGRDGGGRSSTLPADQLTVTDGVVHAKSDAAKKATYAELIGGRYFNVQLEWNKQIGNTLYAPGKAKPKDPKDYKIVGKPIKREDIAPKVVRPGDVLTDVKVPGMVHGRMIRPPVAGAVPVKVDESSIKDIPGARVVRENNFLARRRRQGMGRDQGVPEAQGRMVGRSAAVPRAGRALRPHPQGAGAQARGRQAGRQRR